MISLCAVIAAFVLQNHRLKAIVEALINYIVHAMVLILLSPSFETSELRTTTATTAPNKSDTDILNEEATTIDIAA